MPVLKSDFIPPAVYRGAHVQTIVPTLVRSVSGINYERHRMRTSDGDFVDLDWSYAVKDRPADSAAILCHGLEGSSDRAYMRGMAGVLNRSGIDAVSYNYRGCSGEPNLKTRVYTAGATDDLNEVVEFVRERGSYANIYLVGFSLGGNLVLKYAGDQGSSIDASIKGITAISVPCDLRSSAIELDKPKNRIYNLRFIKMLREKIRSKYSINPELKEIDLDSIRTLKQFDDVVTAPLNGYKDAEDYWSRASSLNVLDRISVPTLILNAGDDPILGPGCYPQESAAANPHLFLEIPAHGGHVGFMHRPKDQEYWHELRTARFLVDKE